MVTGGLLPEDTMPLQPEPAEERGGEHCAWLYETEEAYASVVLPFVHQGLHRGEQVFHLASAGQSAALLARLRTAGVEVEAALHRGDLVLLTPDEVAAKGGALFPAEARAGEWLRPWRLVVELVGEERFGDREALSELESWLQQLATRQGAAILCVGARHRLPAALALDFLSVHPRVRGAEQVYENSGFLPPAALKTVDREALLLQQWLLNLETQHRLQEALLASEERLELMLASDYDWEYWLGVDGCFQQLSPACELITGYTAAEFLRDPGLLLAIVHPADRQRVAEHLDAELLLTDVSSLDFRLITRDGEVRWIEHKCQPIFGRDGHWLGRRASNRDVTRRYWAEERYRILVDHSLQGLVIFQDQRIVFANAVVAAVLGRPVETLATLTVDDLIALVHPDDRARLIQQIGECLGDECGSLRQEYRIVNQQGAVRWLEHFIAHAIYHGRPALQVVIIDITERKAAEARLQRQNQLLTLLYHAGQAINASLELDQVLATMLEETRRLLQVVACSVWLVDPATGEVVCRQATGPGHEQVVGWRLAPGQGLVGWTLQHQESLLVDDAAQDSRHFVGVSRQLGLTLRSILSVPLRGQGQVIGVLQAVDSAPGRFGSEDVETVELLAAIAATAIENARLYEVQRQVEEALRRERDFTAAVLDAADVLINIIDSRGRVVRVNRTHELLTGWTTAELQGRYFWEVLVPPEQQALVQARFEALLAGHAPRQHENDCWLRDGRRRLIRWSDAVLSNARGEPEYLVGVGIDITEQRRAEQALRESRHQYQAVSELTSDYAYALGVDSEGRLHFEWVTDAFTRITGYTPDELEYKGFHTLIFPDDVPIWELNHQLVLAGQQQVSQFRIVTKQGEKRWLRQHERPEWDARAQRVVRIWGAAQDVTERKWLEDALRTSQQQLNALITSADDLIFMVELPSERFTYVHLPARYHWSETAVLGKTVAEVLSPENLTFYRERGRQVVETGAPCTFEWGLHLLEETRYFSITLAPIRNEAGAIIALSGIGRDITQRKRLEETLVRTERLALAGRLAASVAHEINNPLQSILGSLGLAREALLEGQPVGSYLQIAMDEVRRIARIVDRMSDLYRPDSEKQVPTDINQLVEEVLELGRRPCREQQVELLWQPAAGLPPLLVMPERLKQVFWNLLLNALAAMPSGGRLEISTRQVAEPWQVAIQFTDTGTGIPPEVLPRIFEPFYSTRPGGTGLGLSISAGIVEQHGGRIEVQSQWGEGATFTVYLPVRLG